MGVKIVAKYHIANAETAQKAEILWAQKHTKATLKNTK
jgi:hypothetical protein